MEIEGYTYIQHQLKNRPWGPECQFTVARLDGSHINQVIPIPSMDISQQDLTAIASARLAHIKAIEDREALYIKAFDDFGPELKEALFWLIRKIRQYPEATYAQAESAWNAEWANSLFTFAKLAAYVQARAGGLIWTDFKTLVIDRLVRGVD